MVTSYVTVLIAFYPSGNMGKSIPDRRALAVGLCSTFNLVGGGSRPPDKISWKFFHKNKHRLPLHQSAYPLAFYNSLEVARIVDIKNNDYLDDAIIPKDPKIAAPKADEMDHDVYDGYIQAKVKLMRNGVKQAGRVIARKKDGDNRPVGRKHANPLLDTREYVVDFANGSSKAYSTNVIAKSIYSQVNEFGRTLQLLDEITDHQHNQTAVSLDNYTYVTRSRRQKMRRTTKGWFLNCLWRDCSLDWVALKDLKESHPVQVAEYAINNKIANQPAFAWWVPHTIKKRDSIISKVKSRYWKRTHKYGI